MKYIKSLFLIAAFILTFSGLRAEEITVDSIRYWIDNDQATVTGYVEGIKNAVIPSKVMNNGIEYLVTSIGNESFECCYSLNSIVIPNSVTNIGELAFYSCSSLTSVAISYGVTIIGEGAFSECSSLTSIVIPNSVTYLGEWVFSLCSSLTSIVIPDGVTDIEQYAFAGCSSLVSIIIHSGVKSIGNRAFYNCSSLQSMILPEGVDSLGESVFYGCRSLESISIPSTLRVISYNEFSPSFGECFNLKNVIIKSLNIAENYFVSFRAGYRLISELNTFEDYDYYVNKSYTVTDDSGNKRTISKGYYSYNWKEVKPTHVEFPEGTKLICDNAFMYCNEMKSFTFPTTVTCIGRNAFSNCSSITHLVIPERIDSIGNNAFADIDCYFESNVPAKLASENLLGETGVAIVPADAYDDYKQAEFWHDFMAKIVRSDQLTRSVSCTALASGSGLHIAVGEDNLNSVFNLTVKGTLNGKDLLIIRNKMKNLRHLDLSEASIVANDNLTDYYQGGRILADNELGANAFKDLNLWSIILPKTLTSIGSSAFNNCTNLQSVYIDDNVKTVDNNAFYGCSSLEDIYLGNGVKNIGDYAFWGCPFDTIIFGDSLQTIGSYAFQSSQLKNIEFKDGLVSIGHKAFNDSPNLKNVSLGDGVTTLDREAFRGCTSLETLYLGSHLTDIGNAAFYDCRKLKNVVILNSVKRIGSDAFGNCRSIDTLVIGHKVENIEACAFYGCSGIKDVSFGKSIKEIGRNAFEGCSNITTIMLPTTLKYIRYRAFANCTGLKEFKIPSSVESIENEAFAGNRKLDAVYAYTIEPISIAQNTFSCWDFATLYVPKTSYYTYYLNTQWSQFMTLREFDEPYEYFYLNDDYLLDDQTGRIEGVPDMLLNENSAILVEGDEPQEIAEIELIHNGTDGASIIGGKNDYTGKVENLTAQSMKVNIGVDGARWYFFCFPFDVVHDSIECTSEYVFQTYDGKKRAEQGSGWVKLDADFISLKKGQGYIFQTNRSGTLTIHVGGEYLSFTANNEKEVLHTYAAADAANASWNFIGNPFISYYDVQDLAKEYDAPIIVWNGKGYDVYKPGDDNYMLKPFETFFVQRMDGSQYVELLPEYRLTYTQATTRASQRAAMRASLGTPISLDRQLVNITIMDKDSVSDRTRIVYSTKASMDYEIGVDAAKFQSDGVPQIYTLNETTKYAINERPMGGDDIKLGYTAPKAGVYTLAVPRQDAEIEIYDNVAQAVVDFTFGDYTFESNAGTFNDRFVIHKTSGGVTAVENGFRLDGMTVTAVNGGIEVEGHVTGKVSVYSESGMLLDEITRAGHIELVDGVYIIKIAEKSVKICVGK